MIEEVILRDLSEKGLPNRQMAEILRVSRATITRYKTYYGIKSKFSEKKHEIKECLNCSKYFDCLTSEKRKFCSKSCSVTYTNIEKGKDSINKNNVIEIQGILYKKCINCGVNFEIKRKDTLKLQKYCSSECHKGFNKKERYKKIEDGCTSMCEGTYKKYLIDKYGEKCMKCGWCEIHPTTGKIPIQLEHIDGNYQNNSIDNLKLLCPNCHSLTSTFGSLNKGNGRTYRYKNKNIDL